MPTSLSADQWRQVFLPVYLPVYLPVSLPVWLPVCLLICLPVFLPVGLSAGLVLVCLPVSYLYAYRSVCWSGYRSVYQSGYRSICRYDSWSICRSAYRSLTGMPTGLSADQWFLVFLPVYLPISLLVWLPACLMVGCSYVIILFFVCVWNFKKKWNCRRKETESHRQTQTKNKKNIFKRHCHWDDETNEKSCHFRFLENRTLAKLEFYGTTRNNSAVPEAQFLPAIWGMLWKKGEK